MVKQLVIAGVLGLLVCPAWAQAQRPRPESSTYLFDAPARTATPAAPAARPDVQAPKDPYVDRTSETSHVTRIGGQEIRYTATAGSLPLQDSAGTVKAHMFFVAYTRDGVVDASTRPVMFAYNGGPGSASVWLHMGALGPKKVQLADEGFQPAPPFRIVDNEDSVLDVTDIVMIDAMDTGFSRTAAGVDPRDFHGSTPDIQTFGEFIRTWLTRYKRWPSPKFLFGESYGTTRSAGLAAELQQRHGIELSGIVLLSAVVDFGTQEYDRDHDIGYVTYLPTLTATAWYHKKLPADLQADLKKAVEEAKAFAMNEYLVALAKGNRLTDAERTAVATKLSRYTGLSEAFILSCHLRVTDSRFRKELLRDRGVMVGRLDGRFTGLDADYAGEWQEFDPANTALQGAYTAIFNDYIRRDLKYENDVEYRTSGNVRPWSYAEFQNRYVNMTEPLRSAMARNPSLKVFVGNGYYDMATPFFSTQFTFDHLGFEPTYRDRVSMGFYEAGHMVYIRPSAHKALKQDVAQFIRSCTAAR